jgi:Holliday junction resolvase RusA-like endonuclease
MTARRTVLYLPVPPTANNLFPTGKLGRRFTSPEYRAWKDEAGKSLLAQHRSKHPGRVRVTYEVARPLKKDGTQKRQDLGNKEKASSDLLVAHRVILDDSLIEELVMRWADDLPQGVLRATVVDA